MTLPYKLLAVLLLLAGTFGAGWVGHVRYRAAADAKDALALSEANRETERLAARTLTKVTDVYIAKSRAAAVVAADTRVADARVRDALSETASHATPAVCPDGARVPVLTELLSACASLLREGSEGVDRLGAQVEGLQGAGNLLPVTP